MPSITVRGVELFYRESGQGAPVLFIQGLGVDHRGWAGVAPALADRFRCITYDNRDIGRSSTVDTPYTAADLADDAAALLDALGVARADIVGTSMGGVIAQELAIRHPARVGRLVLITTYTSGDPRGVAIFETQARLRRTLPREEYLRSTFWTVYGHQDYRRAGFVEGMIERAAANDLWQSDEAYGRHVRAAVGVDTEARLATITAPTLILAGADDILSPMRFARTLNEGIAGSRLIVVEGAGHGMIWSHAERVVAEVGAFLA